MRYEDFKEKLKGVRKWILEKLDAVVEEAPHLLDEKLPPFATIHQVAHELARLDYRNEVYIELEGWSKMPRAVAFIDPELNGEKFWSKLKKHFGWHHFEVIADKSDPSIFHFENENVSHTIRFAQFSEKDFEIKKLNKNLRIF